MDITGIANLSTMLSQQRTAESAGISVLKKALDIQESAAMTLIDSVTPQTALPPHLGQNVNIVA